MTTIKETFRSTVAKAGVAISSRDYEMMEAAFFTGFSQCLAAIERMKDAGFPHASAQFQAWSKELQGWGIERQQIDPRRN
jgi:hypothetical protein